MGHLQPSPFPPAEPPSKFYNEHRRLLCDTITLSRVKKSSVSPVSLHTNRGDSFHLSQPQFPHCNMRIALSALLTTDRRGPES